MTENDPALKEFLALEEIHGDRKLTSEEKRRHMELAQNLKGSVSEFEYWTCVPEGYPCTPGTTPCNCQPNQYK